MYICKTYVHTHIYICSFIKRRKFSSHNTDGLSVPILSEISLTENEKHCMFSLTMWNLKTQRKQ